MFENYLFQMDVDDPSSWLLYYDLRDIFRLADPNDPQATFNAIQHVFESRNVEDLSQHPDSPYRHKPAYLVDGSYAMEDGAPKSKVIVTENGKKRWGGGGTWEQPPSKDWSTLGR